MLETAEATTPGRTTPRDIGARVAGAGAVGFAAIVLLQNVIRGGEAPANEATSKEVLTYYTDHRAVTVLLMCTFVLSGIALAMFLGGAMRRLVAGGRQGWAYTGLVGAVGIMTLFGTVVAADEAMSVVANTQLNPAALDGLWALHNSIFTVLFLFIGVALLGLSKAGVAAGITPRVFERLGPIGFALLALASMAGPYIAAGDAMPIFGLGGIGFLIWIAFLVTTGVRLISEERS